MGESFDDVDALALSDRWKDWVVVGRFGPNGPFTVAAVKTCDYDEPCSFSHNGQGHTYSGFDGFKLSVIRLEADSGEVSHVVLRSRSDLHGQE